MRGIKSLLRWKASFKRLKQQQIFFLWWSRPREKVSTITRGQNRTTEENIQNPHVCLLCGVNHILSACKDFGDESSQYEGFHTRKQAVRLMLFKFAFLTCMSSSSEVWTLYGAVFVRQMTSSSTSRCLFCNFYYSSHGGRDQFKTEGWRSRKMWCHRSCPRCNARHSPC